MGKTVNVPHFNRDTVEFASRNAPINVNPVAGGVRARGGDLMPGTIPYVGLLIV